MWKEPRISKLIDLLKYLESKYGMVYRLISEIKQLLPAAKPFQHTQKTLFITVIILLDNFILIYCRPKTFTEISFFIYLFIFPIVVFCVVIFVFFEAFLKFSL